MTDSQLDELITLWASGEISAEDFERLEARLASEPGARSRLRQHALLDDLLRELTAPKVTLPAPAKYALTVRPLALAAMVGLVAIGIVWLMGPRAKMVERVEQKEPAAVAVARENATIKPAAPSPPAVAPRGLPTISSLQFGEGTSKLRLDGIGSMLIEGPADFSLIGPMRAKMTRGRIKVRVTEKTGHGFVVETPYGEVTDLGTEFGLDLTRDDEAGLVVFEGSVDLRVPSSSVLNGSKVQRLIGGEAVTFGEDGTPQRLMAITSGGGAIFAPTKDSRIDRTREPIIVDVSDNLPAGKTRKFYEIVPGGLQEDTLAFVDRQHEWNGKDSRGIPSFLLGADYVKCFNENKLRMGMEVQVTLARPARLYVFLDTAMEPPTWLQQGFKKTGKQIGLDGYSGPKSRFRGERGKGPGVSIEDRFNIWERIVREPSIITLGSANTGSATIRSNNYGIAAVPLIIKKGK